MKLNLQAIRIAEQLLGKPFGEFDLQTADDADMLVYSTLVANSSEAFTHSTYTQLSKKVKTQALKKITTELAFLKQFSTPEVVEVVEVVEADDAGKKETPYMGEVAAALIMAGMGAHFVLYEMGLFELKDYLAALDAKIKNKFESNRLWTYYTILPHVDSKKLKSPRDLFLFPWEVEQVQKEKDEELKRGEIMFNKFMESKPIRYGKR